MEVRSLKENIGCLYVVATPIGNLEDITYRAVRVLSEVDMILCEDTRQTLKLLNKLEIKKPLKSYHSYNEKRVVDDIIIKLKNGSNLALVSDSGTPCISDPGFVLLSHAINDGIQVIPIPGPSAFLALLSICGFPTSSFQFIGFLPIKKNKRLKILNDLQNFKGIIILYESPYRIIKLLNDLLEIFPNNQVVMGRELTKKFETIYRGTTQELATQKNNIKPKGEFTILINNFT
ncbi:MAG: 16S rRNA (cytidine(1402)-2'-O)-methyltransferase [Spirochaetota bacterium]|nr:16S rRNA (cytidine(1402)-2'-O)-methyltransferase [Spirochaetota bacterium]